jgi:DNA-binding SARP family transcriptional activator/tetratricopeptide (TPR) repeat protein/DNA-binding XRE family transcriptional regulator
LIRTRRRAAGLTQQEVASRAGVSLGAIRDLEQGRTVRPRPELVVRLAEVLGFEAVEAVEGVEGSKVEHAQDASGGQPIEGTDFGAWTPPANGLWLRVLGPIGAWRDGSPLPLNEPRLRVVLGLLALNAGTSVHRESLVDALWRQTPPAAAVNIVQTYIGRLRRVLDPGRTPRDPNGLLVSMGTTYRLRTDADHLDWLAFQRLTRTAASADGPVTACAQYEQALALWHRTPLADVDTLRGHPAVAAAIRAGHTAIADFADAAAEAGRSERVLPHLWRWADEDRLNEQVHALLMLALAATGQQAAALAVFAEVRDRLDAQLGVQPGTQLTAAHLRVLRQEVPAPAVRREPGTGWSPGIARQLPAAAGHFAGRTNEIKSLDALLDASAEPGGTVVVSTVTGTAGIGKSALALQWAHRVVDRFPDGQLYVNLRGFDPNGPPVGPAEAIRGFLDALGVPVERIPRNPAAQAALYRSLLSDRRVLLVLDNACDSQQVRPLLPGSATAMVIVTSRDQLTGLVVEGAHPLTLDLLSPAEAFEMLASQLGHGRVLTEPHSVEQLTGLCARLPLALRIAAARAAVRPNLPLATLVSHLRDARSRLDALYTGEEAGDLRAVFSHSYERLSPPAARMFRLLALCAGPTISHAAAASLAGLPSGQARMLIDELVRASLLSEPHIERYAFHDLLRAYAAERADYDENTDEREAATRRILDHYLHTARQATLLLYPQRDPISVPPADRGVRPERLADRDGAMDWFVAEHQTLMAAIQCAATAGFDSHVWRLAWCLTTYLDRRGHWADQASTHRAALKAADQLDDRAGQAYASLYLARSLLQLGDLGEAETRYRDAVSFFSDIGDRTGQAQAHRGVGKVLERQGRHREALAQAEQALQLYRDLGHQSGVAIALNNIGWYHIELGDPDGALAYCQHALDLLRQIDDRDGQAGTLDTLGSAYHHSGRYAEAIDSYRRALALWRDIRDRYSEAVVLMHLGNSQDAAGSRSAAHDSWQRAMAILDELGHADADKARAKLQGVNSSDR